MNYSIGIIDDDSTKITQLLTYLDLGWEDGDGNLLKKKYEGVLLTPIEIELESTEEEMVHKVYETSFLSGVRFLLVLVVFYIVRNIFCTPVR